MTAFLDFQSRYLRFFLCGILVLIPIVGHGARVPEPAVASAAEPFFGGVADTVDVVAGQGESEPFFGGSTDTVYVTAARLGADRYPAGPAVVTIVPLAERTGGADLAELLSRTAGLQVRRYGGLGAPAVPSIRGSSAAQITILVDGVPLVDAEDGAVDLSTLPLDRFERAEVYRGLWPAPLAGGGGAGAINLISRGNLRSGSDLRLFTGSFGDLGGRWLATAGSEDGRRTGRLLLHGRRIDNRFEFLDHNQTFTVADDDLRRQRANAQFAEFGSSVGGQWEQGRWRGRLNGGFFRKTGGRPGPLGYESPGAGLDVRRLDGRFSLETIDERLRLVVAAHRTEEILHDPAGEALLFGRGTVHGVSDDLSGRLALGRNWVGDRVGLQLKVGADGLRQWYTESWNERHDPERVRTTVGGFASLQLSLFGPRLTVFPSWRWQQAEDDFPPLPDLPSMPEVSLSEPHLVVASSPSAGLMLEAVPGRFFVEGHAARTTRLPTWVELFGHRGGIIGNRELLPERLTTWDLALRYQNAGRTWQVRYALFQTRTEQTILFYQHSPRASKADNFGRTETSGAEWEIAGRLGAAGRLTGNLTVQDARFRGGLPSYEGKRLPFLPELEAAVRFDQGVGPWDFGLTLVHESDNYRDRYNSPPGRAPARTVWNLAVGRRWAGGALLGDRVATATAELINLTGNDIYDVEGFPLPGRTVRLSLHLR